MQTPSVRYYPGRGTAAALPLGRFLPPLPPGMVTAWLAENIPPGSWVLDPLGSSPALGLEAARAGYRVLVASNNPILSFMTEILAGEPKGADFQSALAGLAASKRGEDRLEKYLQGLYLTECDTCGERVPAQAYLWRKGDAHPFARLYRCPKCGESGERAVTKGDLERLAAMGGDKLQRARALQRVILNDEEHRGDVEEALESYLARPLFVLFTLINKSEGLAIPAEQKRLLQALLISTFDAGNTLWSYPGGRARPRQLTVPPQFRENNLWLALEGAVDEWTGEQAAPVKVTRWPEQPDGPGICLFRGRVKALMPLPGEIDLRAALALFPRPNQAFWTLSALWAGWLWGAEAALPLRNVLDRRRYDWNWHTAAMHSALSALSGCVSAEMPFFGILPELAPGFLSAAIVAAQAAGFSLQGIAMRVDSLSRSEQELAQAAWLPSTGQGAERTAPAPDAVETAAGEAVRADLLERAEPAAYLTEYAAGLSALAGIGAIPRSPNSLPGDPLARIQAVMARTFANRALLRVFSARAEKSSRPEGGARVEPAEEERGAWFLAAPHRTGSGPEALPLADRVEMEVVRFMQKRSTSGQEAFPFEALDQVICEQFTGLLTPPAELVRACMESYGEAVQAGSEPLMKTWRMRASELAAARKADLQEMRAAIEAVGRRLGYATVEEGSALVWVSGGAGAWWFYRMASSILSRYVLGPRQGPVERSVLVLPGSRARLLSYKLRRDPHLAEAVQGWRFLKFRHLREIAAGGDLTLANWTALLDEDPLTDEATQMELFSN